MAADWATQLPSAAPDARKTRLSGIPLHLAEPLATGGWHASANPHRLMATFRPPLQFSAKSPDDFF
jgi:hypothetical protein